MTRARPPDCAAVEVRGTRDRELEQLAFPTNNWAALLGLL